MEQYRKKIATKFDKEFLSVGTKILAYGIELEIVEINQPNTDERANTEIRKYPYVCRKLDGSGTFSYSFYPECRVDGAEIGTGCILGNAQDKRIK